MTHELNHPLPHPADPWDARFGFFWYNDQEIFHDSEADLDHKAAAIADAGINHVITFSCTHFRWSFRRHWPLLTETLAKIVRACHRHGIYVTEHHSSHLTFNPLTVEESAYIENVLRVRGSSRASWPHLEEDMRANPVVIDDVRLSSLRQIDGRTGQWARSNYRGWCMCFNNPDYRRAYLAYLETLYATGIDGIMTDDVQWFGQGHSCACPHCRRLFRERYGYEMPQPGEDWERWWGDYDDPSYRAWLDFRLRSIEDFHVAVKEHYESLGLRPLRPNYVSHALVPNPTAYALETLPHLDWVFQESCFTSIIRYSWPVWALEAMHRFAVARRRGIPPMDIFYPDRPDSMRFCWALAQSWGVLYLATPEGKMSHQQEKPLRDFERAHIRLLRRPQRYARLAFYDSRPTREQYRDLAPRTLRALKAWLQACYMRSIPCDLFQREELARLSQYDVVVLSEIAYLSDHELRAFRDWVQAGGTLVWIGRTASQDETGAPRAPDTLAAEWELSTWPVIADDGEPQTIAAGSGRLVLVPLDWNLGQVAREYSVERWRAGLRTSYAAMSAEDKRLRDGIVALLRDLLPGEPDLAAASLPDGVIATLFRTADGQSLVIHLVNAAGTLAVPTDETISHDDVIPFPSHAGKPTIALQVRRPSDAPRAGAALLHTLQHAMPLALPFQHTAGSVIVSLDPALIVDYALIEVRFDATCGEV